ncbi:MAG: hypothetical protein MUC99_04530 [Anaerolineae bacterium]|nr:hypothetical protein [Anaerolineae bacterium]
MAHHEEENPGISHDIGLTPVTLGLAVLAGSGMTLMIVAGGVGVITGGNVGLWFIIGALALIGGGVAWVAIERPFTHFDDINKPLDGGHGHAHAADEHADDAHDAHGHAKPEASHGHGAHH